jgi:lambda family phage portal protein
MHSRQLARGDAYASKFTRSCVDNIAGPDPFVLQSKVKFAGGLPNTAANKAIEAAWWARSRAGVCEVTGKLSLGALHRLIIRSLSRDGEALIRTVRGGQFGGGALQILDVDRLDELYNENLKGGGSIKMGVELDSFSRPVAYHLLVNHPGEMGDWGGGERKHERVPADQIRHLFIADWPEQARGIPWMHAAMVRLWHLGGFEEAAVINARVGASKIATIETPDGEPPESMATGRDSAGNMLQDVEPGQYWTLPSGSTLGSFTPQFPDTAIGPFISACLRGAAAGLGMAYHSLANDPGAVNYSTARVALLEERDMWTSMQQWYVDHFCQPDFEDWLRGAILTGKLPQKYWDFRDATHFQAKTWKWVDPMKEVGAKIETINAHLTSHTRICAEDGLDFEEELDQMAADIALAKSKGIDLVPVQPKLTGVIPDTQAEGDSTAQGSGNQSGKAMPRYLHAAYSGEK